MKQVLKVNKRKLSLQAEAQPSNLTSIGFCDLFPDKIVVLQKGKIVESGTFDELVNLRGGYFNQLVEKQSIAK